MGEPSWGAGLFDPLRSLHLLPRSTSHSSNAGVALVSCTENIDDTPSGMLLHGIMSSIAEFYSRNLANEVIKGSVQKAKAGGTRGRAPTGYLNVRKIVNGQRSAPSRSNPVRGPLMDWAFEAYATGQWTLRTCCDEPPTRAHHARTQDARKPLALSHLHTLLRHPYYMGIVRYRGEQYPGRHEPLVSAKTWQRVQELLAAKSIAGTRQQAPPLPQGLHLVRRLREPAHRLPRQEPSRHRLSVLHLPRPPAAAHRLQPEGGA